MIAFHLNDYERLLTSLVDLSTSQNRTGRERAIEILTWMRDLQRQTLSEYDSIKATMPPDPIGAVLGL